MLLAHKASIHYLVRHVCILHIFSENVRRGDPMINVEESPTLIADPKQRGILIVEDDWGPREAMRYLLKSRSYANVHFAQNGQEALDKLSALGSAVYLILLDIRMPVMDGMTFLRRFAGDCRHPVGVIAATGFPSPDGKREFLEIDSKNVIPLDYISKPFELSDMLESVFRSLDRIHTQREAVASA